MEAARPGVSRGKLVAGVRLVVLNPQWNRTCADCRQWVYRDDGRILRTAGGDLVPRGSNPTPCVKCPKVPQWAKDAGHNWHTLRGYADEWSDANREAYRAYKEFRAVGLFPDDVIVRWYAALIREVEDGADRTRTETHTAAVSALVVTLAEVIKRPHR